MLKKNQTSVQHGKYAAEKIQLIEVTEQKRNLKNFPCSRDSSPLAAVLVYYSIAFCGICSTHFFC